MNIRDDKLKGVKKVPLILTGNKWFNGLLATTLLLCAIPFFGLLIYFVTEYSQGTNTIPTPSIRLLVGFALTGGLLPLVGLCVILKKLFDDRAHFKLMVLIEAYFSLIIIFASMFTLLQVSSLLPAFKGATVMWTASPLPLSDHLMHLYKVFFEFSYLSVITITTVGYGDVIPISPWSKMLTGIEGLLGIGFIGIALGHYFSVCIHQRRSDSLS